MSKVPSTAWTLTPLADGQVLRLALANPPRNILDRRALALLPELADRAADDRRVKAILLTADGPNFSLGASVAEHAPQEAPGMLAAFTSAVLALAAPCVPIVSAVRGHCLGGGLELALLSSRIIAHTDARLGQPEIRLGAFAPLASLLLPRRLGQARAEELLLTGRVVDASEALALGLVEAVVPDDPEAAALAWITANLLPHSAAALRLTCRAARFALLRELDALLPVIDALYRNDVLATDDAAEGVRAFLEKRAPVWSDR